MPGASCSSLSLNTICSKRYSIPAYIECRSARGTRKSLGSHSMTSWHCAPADRLVHDGHHVRFHITMQISGRANKLKSANSYLSNTPTNLFIALYCILLYCVVLNCIVLLIYCYVDIIQYNGVHKFVGVLDNPRQINYYHDNFGHILRSPAILLVH